jgi:hypothetical protein
MLRKKLMTADLNGMIIGATGSETLQIEVFPKGAAVVVKMTAAEARWLAHALCHWADVSEGKPTSANSN